MQMMLSRVPREMLEEMLKNMPAGTGAAAEETDGATRIPVGEDPTPSGRASRAQTGCC
jgi:hypothetical protein